MPLAFLGLAVALAGPTPAPAPPEPRDTGSFILASLSGMAGAGLGGYAIGALAAPFGSLASCGSADNYDCDAGPYQLGFMLGSNAGATLGVTLYGWGTGREGSGVLTAIGSVAGQLLGVMLLDLAGQGTSSSDLALLLPLLIPLQGLGAAAGYALTARPIDERPGPVAHGGLLDYDPAHGLRLGAPSGGIAPDTEGGYTLGFTLAAGAF